MLRDKLRQEITVGCYILFSGGKGVIRFARVLEIKDTVQNLLGGPYILARVTVWGVNDTGYSEGIKPSLQRLKTTLRNPDTVLVIPESLIPEEHKEILRRLDDTIR